MPQPKKSPTQKRRSAWVTTTALADELGVTPGYIRDSLKNTVLKKGEHYRNIGPQRWRPTYRWHLKKCLAAVESAALD